MTLLTITDLTKAHRDHVVLDGLSLSVATGSFVSVLGPSGSGKTTLLRLIAGFERIDRGRIVIGDVIVDDASHFVPSDQRRVGYVPQEGSLFPHLSVRDNVGFGLKRRDRDASYVDELIEMVGLGGLGARSPHQLSGGQQQRVALARALAIRPDLVLLDEPFSSLDSTLRTSLRHDVRRVLRDAGATVILVTHDLDEALSLADEVAVVSEGAIRQVDTPARLYARPRSAALARAMGNVNFLSGTLHGDTVETALGVLGVSPDMPRDAATPGTVVDVLIRPEQVLLGEPGTGTGARVLGVEFYGHDAILSLRVDALGDEILTARSPDAQSLPATGDHVTVSVRHDVMIWPRGT